jgi:hypothetical protein
MDYEEVEEGVDSTTTEDEDVIESSTIEEDDADFSEEDSQEDEFTEEEFTEEEDDELSTEGEAEEPASQKGSKTQKRINELVRQRKEAESQAAQAKNTNTFLMQQLSMRQSATPAAPVAQPLKEPVYSDYEEKYHGDVDLANREYHKDYTAFAVRKAMESKDREARQNAYQTKVANDMAEFKRTSYNETVLKKYPDFQNRVYHPTVELSQEVKELIYVSPQGHDIAYKLATDQALRDKINRMSPAMAGKEIGSLERLYAAPVKRKFKSKAPKGITPVGTKSNAKGQSETDMPIDEFLKREDEKIAKERAFF